MTDYTWEAVMKDGSKLSQFEGDTENLFLLVEEADQLGLVSEFHLYPSHYSPELCRCYIDLVNKKLVSITCNRHVDCSSISGTPNILFKKRHSIVIDQYTKKVRARHHTVYLGFKFGSNEIYMTFPNSTNSCDREIKSKGIDLASVQVVSGLP